MRRTWKVLPKLTDLTFRVHTEANMLGGPYPPEMTIRIAEMAASFLNDPRDKVVAMAAGLLIQTDRELEARSGVRTARASKDKVRELVLERLRTETDGLRMDDFFTAAENKVIANVVVRHDEPNDHEEKDDRILIAIKDAVRIVSAGCFDFLWRSGQFYPKLPAVDYAHLGDDPEATYRDPRSVLRDIVESTICFEASNPWSVRSPRALKFAEEAKTYFAEGMRLYLAHLKRTGLHPYPDELRALREKYAPKTT